MTAQKHRMKRWDWLILSAEQSRRTPSQSFTLLTRERTNPFTQRVVPRNVAWHSRSGRNPKHTSRPATITSRLLCNKSSNFSNACTAADSGSSWDEEDATASTTGAGFKYSGWFVQELLMSAAAPQSRDFNWSLHPKISTSWYSQPGSKQPLNTKS